MTISSANLAQMRYSPEDAFGVIKATGNCINLRMTGESLAFAIKTDTSKEIRSDRMKTDLVPVSASASGGINFELSYKEYDTLMEAALCGTWAAYGTAGQGSAVALGINSTAGTLTAGSAPTGADAWSGLAVGQWFKLTAPSDAADGAFLKVGSITGVGTIITVDTATPIPGTGTRAGVAACVISSQRLTNGTTQRSFSLERGLTDVNQFFAFRGMTLDKMSMNFASAAFAGGSFTFMGKDSVRSATTQLAGTPVASQTYDIMNAVSGVGNVLENGAALAGTFIKSLKFDVDNATRARDAIGVYGAASIGLGSFSVTGTIEVYLADGTMYDKFVNNTSTSLVWSAKDGSNNGYVFQFPKVKFGDAKVAAGGLDQDVMISMPFSCLMDATTSKEFLIDKLGA